MPWTIKPINNMNQSIFRVLIIAIPLILSSVFCSAQDSGWQAPEQASQISNPLNGDLKATMKGKKIYQKLCWSCHGMEGTGDGPAAATLSPKPANFGSEKVKSQSDGALFWKIGSGNGQMAAFDQTLSEQQRWMLVNYIRHLGTE